MIFVGSELMYAINKLWLTFPYTISFHTLFPSEIFSLVSHSQIKAYNRLRLCTKMELSRTATTITSLVFAMINEARVKYLNL